MQFDQLDNLEEKITKAVQLISELQTENATLKEQNNEFISRLRESEKTIQLLREENKMLKEQKGSTQNFTEKEEKIKQKIEGMLAKLDSFQHISSV